MATTPSSVEHPYIVRDRNLAGGAPVIRGTKFPVRSVVHYVLRQGITPEELAEEFPQLSLTTIYDALSYYYDHKEEIDLEMKENSEARWKGNSGGGHGDDPTLPG
jgi:uncharacterized protein (DUF433 family)